MKKIIRNLCLAGIFFLTVSFDSCTLGVSYDKKYKIYPESDFSDCMFVTVYGKRWERYGLTAFSIGAVLTLVAFIAWRSQKQREAKSILNYIREE